MLHRGAVVILGLLIITPSLARAQAGGAPLPLDQVDPEADDPDATPTAPTDPSAPQPPPPDPTPPPAAAVAVAVDPDTAIERGLMRPAGHGEVEAYLYSPSVNRLDTFNVIDLSLSGRYSLGTAELFAGVELVVHQPGTDDEDVRTNLDTLQVVWAGARLAAGQGDLKVRLTRVGNDSDLTWIEAHASYEQQYRLAPQVALIGEGGGMFHHLSFDREDDDQSAYALYLYARGAALLQASPEIALQLGLQLSVPVLSGDSFDDESDWNTVFGLFAEVAYDLGQIDVFLRSEVHRDRILLASQVGTADIENTGQSLTAFLLGARARF